MTSVPATGALAQLGIDTNNPTTVAYEFVSSSLRKVSTLTPSEGVRGTRSREKYRVRETQQAVTGSIVMNPTATEIDGLLPWILGGTTAVGVTDVADALTSRYVQVDKISKVYTYDECLVSRAIFSGSQGNPIQLTLDVEGKSETEGNAGSFPSLTLPTDNMFVFSDITLTLLASARPIESFTLTIDNVLTTDRYMNNLTRDDMVPTDRIVTLDVRLPFTSDNTDLYDIAIAGDSALTLAWADGTDTYTIAAANAKAPAEGPESPGRDELFVDLSLSLFADQSNSECKFTKS